jgi:hypothetical protein
VTKTRCLSASKLLFWLRYHIRKSGSKKCQMYRFEMLNVSSVTAVQRILILMWLDQDALPMSFKAFILIEISSKQEHLKTCHLSFPDVEHEFNYSAAQSASKLLFLIEISSTQERFKRVSNVQIWYVEHSLNQRCSVVLNIDVNGPRCAACQLPSFYSILSTQERFKKVSPGSV